MSESGYEPGTCTVIVAREGSVDPSQDETLLRRTEQALSLRSGTLSRTAGMDRPEFKLVEGLSRASADRVAGAALAEGFTPRVRDKLGIRWSSERTPLQLASWVMGLVVAYAVVSFGLGALAGPMVPTLAMPGFLLMLGVVTLVWYRSIALPLIVPRATLAHADPPLAEGDVISDAVRQAQRALHRLNEALGTERVSDAAHDDLMRTHDQLRDRVAALQRRARPAASGPSPAVAVLQDRLERLAARSDPDQAERARLEAALAAEAQAEDQAEARRAQLATELLQIRRAVDEAVDELHAPDPGNELAARLVQQVSHLAAAGDEAEAARLDAARRARQAEQARQG